MSWTTPKTWQVDEMLTAADFNTHLRDNLTALKAPPTAHVTLSSSVSTTSQAFVNVSASLSLTITTSGGDVLVGLTGTAYTSSQWNQLMFDVAVDGVRLGGDNGICHTMSYYHAPLAMVILVPGLTAAAHTFTLQWRVNGSVTGTLDSSWAKAQFWVREVS